MSVVERTYHKAARVHHMGSGTDDPDCEIRSGVALSKIPNSSGMVTSQVTPDGPFSLNDQRSGVRASGLFGDWCSIHVTRAGEYKIDCPNDEFLAQLLSKDRPTKDVTLASLRLFK